MLIFILSKYFINIYNRCIYTSFINFFYKQVNHYKNKNSNIFFLHYLKSTLTEFFFCYFK